MRSIHAILISCWAIMFIVAACAPLPKPEGKPLADITFAHLQPVSLPVSDIEIETGYNIASPEAGYFKPTPDVLFKRYLTQRYAATRQENSGVLTISIPEISLQEKALRKDTPLQPWQRRQTLLYILIKIDLRYDHPQFGRRETSLQARRTTILHENMTMAQRERKAQNVISKLINDLDGRLIERTEILTATKP